MKNPNCPNCTNRTKLYLKLKGRKNYYYMCKSANSCPFSKKEEFKK